MRRLARKKHTSNPFTTDYMLHDAVWQNSQVVKVGMIRVNAGQRWVYTVNGTTNASGNGPTISNTNANIVTDGSAKCTWLGPNKVTNDINTTYATFTAGATPTAGSIYQTSGTGMLYGCLVVNGVNGVTTPTGTGTGISDGTNTWTFYGYLASNIANPNAPAIGYGASSLSTQWSFVNPAYGAATAPVMAVVGTTPGSGNAVGDILTVSGGTGTAATVLVTAVSASGGVTGVSLLTPGNYSVWPANQVSVTSSGSGTGTTLYLLWPSPNFATIHGGLINYTGSTAWSIVDWQRGTNIAPTGHHESIEFWTTNPELDIYLQGGSDSIRISIDENDGRGLIPISESAYTYKASYTAITVTLPSWAGRHPRRWEICPASGSTSFGVIVGDNADELWPPSNNDRTIMGVISDSIWDGQATASYYVPGDNPARELAFNLGVTDPWDFSQAGQGFYTGLPFGWKIPRFLQAAAIQGLPIHSLQLMGSTNDANAVTGATNATPIALTVPAGPQWMLGDQLYTVGIGGNTNANSTNTATFFTASVVGAASGGFQAISLSGTTGNSNYTSGGYCSNVSAIEDYVAGALTIYRQGTANGFPVLGISGTSPIVICTGSITYVVSGITVAPTVGATYTTNGVTFTVSGVKLVSGSGTIICSYSGTPLASGTLTKSGGTGDSSITYTSFSVQYPAMTQLLQTGDSVNITGNSAINGQWVVTVIDRHHFSLNGSTGSGTYVAGGTWFPVNQPVVQGSPTPIFYSGVWSVNATFCAVNETAAFAAITAFNDPYVFADTFSNAWLPFVVAVGTNNPTSLNLYTANFLVNRTDGIHPVDQATRIWVGYLSQRIQNNYPAIK